MAGFTCPFCGVVMAETKDTVITQRTSFDYETIPFIHGKGYHYGKSGIDITFYKCPNCEEYTLFVKGKGTNVTDVDTVIRPTSFARQYPDYIPVQIRSDYEEACSILYLSPKASATLARRCLQGMIRDYWKISKGTLYAEVSELEDKIPADLWRAIDSLRQLGNIGAHMEKDTSVIVDIDPNEAEMLIKLIELLMKEWYINREERRNLFGGIFEMNQEKQAQRKGEG